ARFLRGAAYATTSDFRNFFYAFPIGPHLQRLFHVPALRGAVARLPMGWCRAPDVAAAGAAAMAGLPPGVRQPPPCSRHAASALVCVDNVLVGGPTRRLVSERVGLIEHRARAANATFSEHFGPPRRRVRF